MCRHRVVPGNPRVDSNGLAVNLHLRGTIHQRAAPRPC
jgi:hypothetical protein